MAKLKILTAPHPKLRQQATPVKCIDARLVAFINRMHQTLEQSRIQGVGLSAPQVGRPLRLFIALINDHQLEVFINPQIIKLAKQLNTEVLPKEKLALEGCLSIPNIYTLVERPWKLKLRYQTVRLDQSLGPPQTKERQAEFTDFESSLVQHEIDHLNGILFTDHALSQGSPLYEWDKKEEALREVPIG